jgi:multidrug efflux pump subunit AcrA (membrane-fusion protein)
LPRADAQSHSAGWLLELEHAPEGLGPGARVLVRLQAAAPARGVLVPAAALLYAGEGTYVYRQVRAGAGDTFLYTAVTVRPLAALGSAWLVEGLARTDPVVVQGAGVLWSLQGIGSFSAAEEEHD